MHMQPVHTTGSRAPEACATTERFAFNLSSVFCHFNIQLKALLFSFNKFKFSSLLTTNSKKSEEKCIFYSQNQLVYYSFHYI